MFKKYYRFNGNGYDEIFDVNLTRIWNNDRFTHEMRYSQIVDGSVWKLISYLNLRKYSIKEILFKEIPRKVEEIIPFKNFSTRKLSWKDNDNFKYYVDRNGYLIFKINQYKLEHKKDYIKFIFDYEEYDHKSKHNHWIRGFESEQFNDYDSLEDFVHNRIFDSYYQANKKKLELNPPLTKEQKEELAVKRRWNNINWSKNNSQNGWDDYKPINLL